MSKKSAAKSMLFTLTLIIISVAGVFAQNDLCDLKIEVSRFDNKTPISGATATAVNNKTKKTYKSALRKGIPFFAKLSEGEYKITVSKTGYKKSISEYIVSCGAAKNDLLTTSVPMWEGNSSQVVEVRKYIQNGLPEEATVLKVEIVSETKSDSQLPEGEILNGKATNLVRPEYPAAARAVRASGKVGVQVTIDEQGHVISAQAVSGHPLLRAAAVKGVQESTFLPTLLEGKPVKVTGIVVYNFIP